MLKAQENVTRF